MSDLVKLENFFVNDMSLELLRDKASQLAARANSIRDEVFDFKEKSQEKYFRLLKGLL